jgi:hypothetical protein
MLQELETVESSDYSQVIKLRGTRGYGKLGK